MLPPVGVTAPGRQDDAPCERAVCARRRRSPVGVIAASGIHANVRSGSNAFLTMKLSLRLFLIAAVALLPTTGVLLYNLWSLRQAERERVHEEAARLSQLVALEVDQIIQGTDNLLEAVAASPVVRRGDGPECGDYLASILDRLPQFASVAVIDADGIVRCAPTPSPDEVFVGDRAYFDAALEAGNLVIGEYTDGRVSKAPILPVAIPFSGEGAWSGGVVVASIDLKWLGARLKDRSFRAGQRRHHRGPQGTHPRARAAPEEFVGTADPRRLSAPRHCGRSGDARVTSQDGTRRVVGYRPINQEPRGPVHQRRALPPRTSFAALNGATLRGLLIALLSIILALLLARSTSAAFIDRPFRQLVGTIDKWRRQDVTARTGMTERDGELGAVGKAIDDFMDELEIARASRRKAEQQREMLLGELDHRVKNLLATVQSVARQIVLGRRAQRKRGRVHQAPREHERRPRQS